MQGRAWTCELQADGRPLDWRQDADAHTAWTVSDDRPVAQLALGVAAGLQLGYSCQDWIVDRCGTAWLVDVNPAGQWLFLPEPVAAAVSGAIAEWLAS